MTVKNNTSHTPWMTRVEGQRKHRKATDPLIAPQPPRLTDLSPEEREARIRRPYLKFLDPAHQRVRTGD